MKLQFYAVSDHPPALVPAETTRPWMDAFPAQHAYRCLPLNIANSYGWSLLCPQAFEVTWNGGPKAEDITFGADDNFPWREHFVTSNFTHGIVTFHTGHLIRTEPGWHIACSGPTNSPKDGIAPLSGVIETDWLPYPFTMNWHFTRPGTVRFEAGEPFCQVWPVKAHVLLDVQPEIRNLSDHPELLAEYREWRDKRAEFMSKFRSGDAETLKQAWQRFYFRGQYPDDRPAEVPHVNKLRVAVPEDKRGVKVAAIREPERSMNPVEAHSDTALGFLAALPTPDLTPARCVVLVPFQGRIVSRCQAGLIELERRGYVVRRVEGYSAIDQARNQMGSDALKDGFQETLWIDSDVGFEADDVDRLRRHGLPVTCGIYPKKGKRELAIHILPGTPRFRFGVHGGLHEILYGGTGFLHVRREVYETLIQQLELPVCNEHAKNPMWPFFQPLVRSAPGRGLRVGAVADIDLASRSPMESQDGTGRIAHPTKGHWYLAEDYAFCHRARLCGFPIIADTTIRLWHFGDYAYGWEDAGIDRQRYGDFDFQFDG